MKKIKRVKSRTNQLNLFKGTMVMVLHASSHLMLLNIPILMTIDCPCFIWKLSPVKGGHYLYHITANQGQEHPIQTTLALILSDFLIPTVYLSHWLERMWEGLKQEFGMQVLESHFRTVSNTKDSSLYVISPVSDLV